MAKEREDLIDITIKIGNHPAVKFTKCVLRNSEMDQRFATFIDWTRAGRKPEEVLSHTHFNLSFDIYGNLEYPEGHIFAMSYEDARKVCIFELVFIEIRNGGIHKGSITTPTCEEQQDLCYVRESRGERYLVNWGDYGKKWRIWDDEPTDKERKEAEWSD